MKVGAVQLSRYAETYGIRTQLDPLGDLFTLVQGFASHDYLQGILHERHGLSTGDARLRAGVIAPHIKIAGDYIEQSQSGPRAVAFLPIYYAMLNLAKVYIATGPHHAALAANRWHGASYPGYGKDSQSLLTEAIDLKRGGTIPLLYTSITGQKIAHDRRIRMADVYPYALGISAEYGLATGAALPFASLHCSVQKSGAGDFIPSLKLRTLSGDAELRKLKLLKGYKSHPTEKNHFLGPKLPAAGEENESVRQTVRPFMLYITAGGNPMTPLCAKHLLLPEELPLLLLFFHLSNVVRYKPEFMAKLADSKFWPVLCAAQRHCLLNFLILFWSHMHQRTLSINGDIVRMG